MARIGVLGVYGEYKRSSPSFSLSGRLEFLPGEESLKKELVRFVIEQSTSADSGTGRELPEPAAMRELPCALDSVEDAVIN